MGIVDKRLKTGIRPTFILILGMEINAGVGLRESLNLRSEDKVLEVGILNIACVKKVSTRPVNDNVTILYKNGLWVFRVDLPTLQ